MLLELIRGVAEEDVQEPVDRSTVLEHLSELVITSGAGTVDELLTAVAVGREGLEPELDPESVNILTMHQAKGLSANVVFIMAAEDEYLPQSEEASNIDDNRRLLYVSMTRARQLLFLTYCARRYGPQMYTRRSSGSSARHLTRFLRNGPLRAEPGDSYLAKLVS